MVQGEDLLIERSRTGDREAFEELVRTSARMVFTRAYLECGNVDRAEDLVQETFLTAWKNVSQVRDAKTFRPWLMAILHSVVVDAARRETRKKRGGRQEPGGNRQELERADERHGPADVAEGNEERERALSVLRGLPKEYRDVLSLRYLAGADYETIGRELAISNGSLRGLLNRGLALLRERMKQSEKKL